MKKQNRQNEQAVEYEFIQLQDDNTYDIYDPLEDELRQQKQQQEKQKERLEKNKKIEKKNAQQKEKIINNIVSKYEDVQITYDDNGEYMMAVKAQNNQQKKQNINFVIENEGEQTINQNVVPEPVTIIENEVEKLFEKKKKKQQQVQTQYMDDYLGDGDNTEKETVTKRKQILEEQIIQHFKPNPGVQFYEMNGELVKEGKIQQRELDIKNRISRDEYKKIIDRNSQFQRAVTKYNQVQDKPKSSQSQQEKNNERQIDSRLSNISEKVSFQEQKQKKREILQQQHGVIIKKKNSLVLSAHKDNNTQKEISSNSQKTKVERPKSTQMKQNVVKIGNQQLVNNLIL